MEIYLKNKKGNVGDDVVPREMDVLAIWGRDCNFEKHPGNQKFQALIDGWRREYRELANKMHKNDLIRNILKEIREGGGRFLFYLAKEKRWMEQTDQKKLTDKVSHALRYDKRPRLTKKQKQALLLKQKMEEEGKARASINQNALNKAASTPDDIQTHAATLFSLASCGSRSGNSRKESAPDGALGSYQKQRCEQNRGRNVRPSHGVKAGTETVAPVSPQHEQRETDAAHALAQFATGKKDSAVTSQGHDNSTAVPQQVTSERSSQSSVQRLVVPDHQLLRPCQQVRYSVLHVKSVKAPASNLKAIGTVYTDPKWGGLFISIPPSFDLSPAVTTDPRVKATQEGKIHVPGF